MSMFRSMSPTTRKPGAELIGDFQKKFSHVIADPFLSQSPLDHNTNNTAKLQQAPVFPSQPYNAPQFNSNSFAGPSVVDYVTHSGQQPGILTPTANQMCAVVHSPAGDLHTPTVEWNLASTPSIWDQMVNVNVYTDPQQQQQQQHPLPHPPPQPPHHDAAPSTAHTDMNILEAQYQHHLFQNMDPFGQHQLFANRTTFRASSDYDPLDASIYPSSYTESLTDATQPTSAVEPAAIDRADFPPRPETQFRYRVTLHAPTAIADHAHDPPVTYLNKSQAYSVSIVDSATPSSSSQPVQYRTSVRITFEEPAHRSNPAACWRLWKEARGVVEAQQRRGKMRALEFVDLRMAPYAKKNVPRVQKVDRASFDGFCVTWTGTSGAGSSECVINVRFNFLSTDFSLSKGVKGVPIRLCVKTERISPDHSTPGLGGGGEAEVCYCKVKVFRDHGAERKLSNDVAHVQKAIHKVERQIAQGDPDGANGLGKRKRRKGVGHGLTKNHTVSMSLSPSRANSLTAIDDLHRALFELRNLFSSSQPVSVLSLKGDELDDPDLSPVSLSPDPCSAVPLGRISPIEEGGIANFHGDLVELPHRPFGQYPSTLSRRTDSPDVKPSLVSAGSSSTDLQVLGKVPQFQQVACFYIRIQDGNQQEPYYRAVYLTERTASDLISQLAKKYNVSPDQIVRLVHVRSTGLQVVVDDDVVQVIPEGQDMVAQISQVPNEPDSEVKTESVTSYEVQLVF
ncbi:putative CP2 transcription factor [Aspergillus clavatus NRRL 1]|uniref:CP2 transcription factor, putative n=1 Tax=Aspergillus clavatus (strain ATCC 1007 / CBS 513.65 / DSM 816 / NCTC 3887 / NRRL 1 / QM 1276 / 107) TaxID=344612 RepID=A1CN90_ASPCL|nr:CP2 transcription factor, putative [Aspergillus clavatus NRRL 1]EAW07111.1 CP2 transcription factor, putative [Aspergillus clavatus NRRL 1]